MPKTLLLTCDFEEFTLPLDFGKAIPEQLMFEKSAEGMKGLMEILKRQQIKMTFFVTEKIAETYTGLVKELIAEGHEIGFHGTINHKKGFSREGAAGNLKFLKEEVERKIGAKIWGFRNHKLILVPPLILREAGFIYDNTCHPTYVPGRYFNFFKSRSIQYKNGVTVVPISVSPVLRLPFSWIWFRNFGLNYAKFCTSWVFLTQEYVNIYFHSWEFADIMHNFACSLPYGITRNTGRKMIKFLENYLIWCSTHGIRSQTIHDFLTKKEITGKDES
jgi:uncharacterized protein (DUF3820 family)